MKKDPKVFIQHIKESIEQIENHVGKVTKEKFSKNTIIQDAVIRRIEIIGEAVKNLPYSFRNKHKEIEWKEIAGM